jgi:outer membrane protein
VRMRPAVLSLLIGLALPAAAIAAPLTADEAVRIALQKSPAILQSQASVLSARSGLWSAYSRVMPSLSADANRDGSFTREQSGTSAFGSQIFSSSRVDAEQYSGSYGLSGQWSVLDPAGIFGLSSARSGMKAANLGQRATRADVRLETKRRFYTVVRAIHLSRVSSQALRLSRDDERRVRALFEVGSVSKSDLLKAQVRTSQSQLDSMLADHSVVTSRLSLAQQLGTPERELGELDTTLIATRTTVDAGALLEEARRQRPDLRAAEADVRASELSLRSAHWGRWVPSLSVAGSWTPSSVSSQRFFGDIAPHDSASTTGSKTEGAYSGRVALNVNIFDGFATDARVAAARSSMVRARETRDALVRNLEGEVRQTFLDYQLSVERESLGRRTVESASENLNLVQQKYNVGSATILDLIDAQVQLQRAQSDLVSALADIRVAEAALDRVRGSGE